MPGGRGNGDGKQNRKEKTRDFLKNAKSFKEFLILQASPTAVFRSSVHQALGFVTAGKIHLPDENAIQQGHEILIFVRCSELLNSNASCKH